ncbi:hypothetical protein BH24GEM3_BH24GEM3_01680 [soil metagenome]
MIGRSMRRIPLLAALTLGVPACGGDGGTQPGPTTGSISGRVTEGTSNNVAGAQIGLSGGATRTGTTDAGGAFNFADLAPGGYSVSVTPPQGFRLRSGDTQSRQATVTAGQAATINWDLDRETSGGEVVEIRLTGTSFDPADVTITPGTTVRWVNTDGIAHTVTPENASQTGVWQRQTTNTQGVVFSHTFAAAGQTYRYRCEPHSANFTTGMVGVIRVQ